MRHMKSYTGNATSWKSGLRPEMQVVPSLFIHLCCCVSALLKERMRGGMIADCRLYEGSLKTESVDESSMISKEFDEDKD
ncbi:hypothetical protein ACET3Z_027747 [Daucus carota]